MIDAVLGESFFRKNTVGKVLLRTEGEIKHGMLVADSFHAFRMMQRQLALAHKVSYNKGLSLLEYDKPTIQRLISQGELEPKVAQWVEKNRPTMEKLMKEGLNIGRSSEQLHSYLTANIPGVKIFNNWVFSKLTRGAMAETALMEYDRVKKANPTWNEQQVAAHTAKQMNVYFGNLGRQGLFKSQTAKSE